MKCMCAQTRPRFILSSEGVFGGMEFEPMLTPRGKIPSTGKCPPRGGSNPRHCGQRAQALPTELFQPPLYCLICLHQASALLSLVRLLNVTYVGAVHQNNNYGARGMQQFRQMAEEAGVCVETPVAVDDGYSQVMLLDILRDIR